MSINLYDTHKMLELGKTVKPKSTFLRDRYFPTAPRDIFLTEDVVVDFKDESQEILAPVVVPSKGGIPVARDGYETHNFTPPLVAPERPLTASQLLKRQAGEDVFSDLSPQVREAAIVADDIAELSALIDNREEYMAAQTLFNNGYTLRQYADKYGSATEYVEKELKFYTGPSNPSTYTCATKWDNSGNIIADIAAMATALKKRGLAATDLVVSGKVADVIMSDPTILALLDNRRFILAQEMNPTANDDGSTLIAVLNCKGHIIYIFSYTRQYKDEVTGLMTDYVPEKFVAMTAPGMGHTVYGAVTQVENGQFVTYAQSRVPHYVANEHDNTRTLILQSRPIVLPKVKNAAISSQVLT